jgi:hypothetical protein
MKTLQASMEKQRADLSEKYGVDISQTSVKPDGTIKGPTAPGQPQPRLTAVRPAG